MGAAAPDARSRGAAAWLPAPRPVPHRWLVFGLLALLLLARQPLDVLQAQFNAEEGTIFFQQASDEGFLLSLLSAESGYYHLALRLTAGLALLVPLELAPSVFKLVALAIQLLPVAYLLADDVAGFVVNPLFRVAVALVCVAGPNSGEVYLNVNNSQWHLTLAACLILLSAPRARGGRRTLDAAVLVLFAASGPFSLVCAPLALWSWWRARASGAGPRGSLGPLIVLGGAALQLGYLAAGSRAGAGAEFGLPSAAEIVRILGLHGAGNALLGRTFMTGAYRELPDALVWAAAAVPPLLAVVAFRLRNLPLLTLLYLAAASVAVMFLFPLSDPRLWLSPAFGPRYFYFAMVFILVTLLAAAERGGWWRWCALPGLACALLFGVRGDFRIAPAPRSHWRDQVAVFRTLPRGTDFFVPVHPQPSGWGLTLRRTHPPDGADPLAKYARSGEPARVVVEFIRAARLPESGSTELLLVTGHAADAAGRDPVGGVFLQIDGALFPAVTSLVPQHLTRAVPPPPAGAVGFARAVPVARFGSGTHRLQVLVLDRTRTSLHGSGPPRYFTIP